MMGTLHLKHDPHDDPRREPLGTEAADDLELRLLVCFDAAKRGRCTTGGYDYLMMHLSMAVEIGGRLRLPPLVREAREAGRALHGAGRRPRIFVELTKSEYRAIRSALFGYFAVLPEVELGLLMDAQAVAIELMRAAAGKALPGRQAA
jgi:hypothetical protein